MPEEQLYKTEETSTLTEIAATLHDAADQIEAGSVHLKSSANEQTVSIPADPTFEVELERVTDSETGEEYYELEYELSWVVDSVQE